MPNGRVKWFNSIKGYGFIKQDDGDEIFVPRSVIRGGDMALEEGEKVKFEVVRGPKGLQATNVIKLHMLC